MRRIFLYILLMGGVMMSMSVSAQNGTSSPFSRSAYGELNDNVPTSFRAMGGVGIGMRSNKVICSSQPASYTACDSLTFMFDLAASVGWTRFEDASGMRNKANGNLEYLTLQMPLYKRYIAFSAGLLPYSAVGYDITLSDSINSDYHFTKQYSGEGGINQVYAGLSFNICDWFAAGANIYYMFGDATNIRTLTFRETDLYGVAQSVILEVSSIRLRYGAQLFHTFGDHSFVLGGVFEAKQKMGSKFYTLDLSTDLAISDTIDGFELPMVYGAGVSYCWAKRLTVGVDFQRQCMADAKYYFDEYKLRNRDRITVGVEYCHNPMGRKYVERMQWRVGCNVTDNYMDYVSSKDFAISMGIGLPLRNSGTVFNAAVEYGHRGDFGKMDENYLRLTFNASISENWFFKRKL